MSAEKPALILVVDDDYDFLEINRLILEGAGYRVATAVEPKHAFALMAREKPDLVITDLMMTSLDSGFLFARNLKEDPAYEDVPVIIATSVASSLGLDFRPRSGADQAAMRVDAFFDKPLDAAALLATIAELLAAAPPAESGSEERGD